MASWASRSRWMGSLQRRIDILYRGASVVAQPSFDHLALGTFLGCPLEEIPRWSYGPPPTIPAFLAYQL